MAQVALLCINKIFGCCSRGNMLKLPWTEIIFFAQLPSWSHATPAWLLHNLLYSCTTIAFCNCVEIFSCNHAQIFLKSRHPPVSFQWKQHNAKKYFVIFFICILYIYLANAHSQSYIYMTWRTLTINTRYNLNNYKTSWFNNNIFTMIIWAVCYWPGSFNSPIWSLFELRHLEFVFEHLMIFRIGLNTHHGQAPQ